MLLDEDPATLINQCSQNFNIAPDRAALTRISQSASILSTYRTQTLQKSRSALSSLSRKHQALSSQHSVATSSHNPASHASEILRLDTEKFRIAKQVSDLEIEAERLRQEVEGQRAVLQETEAMGVEGGEAGMRNFVAVDEDAVVLKLKVYRSLGIDVEADPESGLYNKAVIRNAAKGDVHVVNIDPKFSRYFYAKYFWGTL